MPAAGGRDSMGETRVCEGQSRVSQLQVAGTPWARRECVRASHECASCRWQGLKMQDGRGPVTSVPAAGGRDSMGETRVCEGQSRVCQLQVAGTPWARRECVRASHECASCRWQGLHGRDGSV